MAKQVEQEKIVIHKFIYTIVILSLYLVGKCIPLYGVELARNIREDINVQAILFQTISGDINQISIFAIGLSPYLLASMAVQMGVAIKKIWSKNKISPKTVNKLVVLTTLVIAVIQAMVRVRSINYSVSNEELLINKAIVLIQLVTGVMVIMYLAARNKKYGIGGPTAFIFLNIVDGIVNTIRGSQIKALIIPAIISLVVIIIMVIMENAEKRIPVQRISIHNIYADKNYLAIKLNPIGVMPIMFSTAFFMLPQMIFSSLNDSFPKVKIIQRISENLNLSKPFGVVVYIVSLFILTLIFAVVLISPRDLTEQFLKSGDSLLDIHAGHDTQKYLTKTVVKIAIFSAIIMGGCLVAPMIFQMKNKVGNTFVMLPSSIMMLTGIWCNLYQEYVAVKDYESYKPFI